MSILIVDDAEINRRVLSSILEHGGHTDLVEATCAEEAFAALEIDAENPMLPSPFDLVLMDLIMPGTNGVEACVAIKAAAHVRDVPVVMVTASVGLDALEDSFAAGAIDFIKKPVLPNELLARVRSVLTLKKEIDARKARERDLLAIRGQLEKANAELLRLSVEDVLTGIANRRVFDITLSKEWARSAREKTEISLILIDIDHFKGYNDTYGHVGGDECLRSVAKALKGLARRPADLVARYGGEEFAVVLPRTDANGVRRVAGDLREAVAALGIEHKSSSAASHVTISAGCATLAASAAAEPGSLVQLADEALYRAKEGGRNRVETHASVETLSVTETGSAT